MVRIFLSSIVLLFLFSSDGIEKQGKLENKPFPFLSNLTGNFFVISYHGCNGCLVDILDLVHKSVNNKAIIISMSAAETRAIKSQHYSDRIIVTHEFCHTLIDTQLNYYMELIDGELQNKLILSAMDINNWVNQTQ